MQLRELVKNLNYQGNVSNCEISAIAYDSRKDSLVKIKELFPYLNCGGLTPEGLCFDAIKDMIEKIPD